MGRADVVGLVSGSSKPKISRRRIWIYSLLFLLSVVAYVDRISISVGAKLIQTEFHLSPVAMGYVLSAFFWSYLVCLVPAGIWSDRIVRATHRRMVHRVWAAMTAAGGIASNLALLLLTRLGVGVGEAVVFPAGGRVMREWTPADRTRACFHDLHRRLLCRAGVWRCVAGLGGVVVRMARRIFCRRRGGAGVIS